MAQIVNEFVGATSDAGSAIDVQPTTTNIETIEFEARDLGNRDVALVTPTVRVKVVLSSFLK